MRHGRARFAIKDGAQRGRGSSVELAPSHRQVKARNTGRPDSRRSTALQATVAIKFKAQLNLLVKTINQTEPRFVRCIKTNHKLKPALVNRAAVLEQLRYAGVIAALEMRRAGFPSRMLYNDFLLSVHVLLDARVLNAVRAKKCANAKEEARKVLTSRAVREKIKPEDYAFGNTKIFLRADVRHTLDGIMAMHLLKSVTCIQIWYRAVAARKRFLRLRIAALAGQRIVRGRLARKRTEHLMKQVRLRGRLAASAASLRTIERHLEDTNAIRDRIVRDAPSAASKSRNAFDSALASAKGVLDKAKHAVRSLREGGALSERAVSSIEGYVGSLKSCLSDCQDAIQKFASDCERAGKAVARFNEALRSSASVAAEAKAKLNELEMRERTPAHAAAMGAIKDALRTSEQCFGRCVAAEGEIRTLLSSGPPGEDGLQSLSALVDRHSHVAKEYANQVVDILRRYSTVKQAAQGALARADELKTAIAFCQS